jgi:hypothetical protein
MMTIQWSLAVSGLFMLLGSPAAHADIALQLSSQAVNAGQTVNENVTISGLALPPQRSEVLIFSLALTRLCSHQPMSNLVCCWETRVYLKP